MEVDNIETSLPKNEASSFAKQPSVNASLILLSLAALGTITFIIVASSFPFKQETLQTLYPKQKSLAASNVSFVDSSENPIAQTATFLVKVQLSAPWVVNTSQTTPQTTPVPYIVSVALSEDSVTYGSPIPYTQNPMTTTYLFQNTTPCPIGVQCKKLYAKFVATTGLEHVYFNTIELQSTTPIVTQQTRNVPSKSYGIWAPNPKWDTCTKEEHDRYSVVGPDGKKYPTWHDPIHKRSDGVACTFGHEHGRDPSGSALFPFIKEHFGGQGIPFALANESLDAWNVSKGIPVEYGNRHEDHVGHKIEWENNVQLDSCSNLRGVCKGPVVKLDAFCDFFVEIHQETHSKDAFTNNLHELSYFAMCQGEDPRFNGLKIAVTKMVAFGKPGQIGESCNISKTYNIGTAFPPNSPAGERNRLLPTKNCIDTGLGLYEDWVSSNYLKKADGGMIAFFDPHFAVFLPSRYYDQTKLDGFGRSIDLCYIEESNGEFVQHEECDSATNNGKITTITWDDPRSPFNGLHREMYFNQTWIRNSNGPTTWYTDPYGENAITSPFPGSIKQYLSQTDNYNKVNLKSQALRANRACGSTGSSACRGVHAPN